MRSINRFPNQIPAFLLLLFLLSIFYCIPFRKAEKLPDAEILPIIPIPAQADIKNDSLIIRAGIPIIYTHTSLRFSCEYLADFIGKLTGESSESIFSEKIPPDDAHIVLTLDDNMRHPEGYRINIDSNIVISANEPRGIFFGVQTLTQLVFAGYRFTGEILLHSMKIEDRPRFTWRGMHLDVSRHFFGPEFIKKYIDILALHKMNTFHWHLVDDQGWRIEIKKYPLLTEVGAWRVDKENLPWNFRPDPEPGEKATYGGFYTQNEIRDIVEYAAERFITIVPEIEMPAHVQSALAAYPQFSCRQEPLPVPPGGVWPITNIYCAGNDSTFIFLQDVLTEVLDLFPSPYIHIGGDEAHKKEWKACTKCQRRIEEENLEDEDELQSYFIQRIEKFLNEHDRILIGWDEILEGGLADNATVMSWRGIRGGIHAARMDHDVVMTPTNHCYFDYFQSFDKDIEPYAIGGYTDLKKVYAYEPVPDELSEDEAEHILGTQGNVWTEYMLTGSHVEYMALPRMTALSEVQWSKPTRKNEDHFMQRLRYFLNLLSHKDINYHLPAPQGLIPGMVFIDSTTVKLENPYPFGQIRYTTNGEKPVPGNSTVYTGPIAISSDILIQAAVFLENGHHGIIRSADIVHELPRKSLAKALPDLEPGLTYNYYEGAIATLDDFENLDFRHSGVVNSIRFPKNIADDHTGLQMEGFLRIPSTGIYTFILSSNDGSQIYIGEELLIDNDGIHSSITRKSQIALEQGLHSFKIRYFEFEGGQELGVLVSGPDIPEQNIPDDWLFRRKVVES